MSLGLAVFWRATKCKRFPKCLLITMDASLVLSTWYSKRLHSFSGHNTGVISLDLAVTFKTDLNGVDTSRGTDSSHVTRYVEG